MPMFNVKKQGPTSTAERRLDPSLWIASGLAEFSLISTKVFLDAPAAGALVFNPVHYNFTASRRARRLVVSTPAVHRQKREVQRWRDS